MTLQELTQLAEESWEGCDGCDENDKHFFINGFRAGYNTATSDEISYEEIQKQAFKYVYKCKISDNHVYSFIDGIRWYRKQLKQKNN